jgi:hypothetical protein
MSELFPKGLMNSEFEILMKCCKEAASLPVLELKNRADSYLDRIKEAHMKNSIVNMKLAGAIVSSIHTVCEDWETIPDAAKSWCKGMIQYFARIDDDENDLASPIGFDDDADVLNACVKFAGRPDLCVDPEEYDDL